jgi:ribosome maturation factor RimP
MEDLQTNIQQRLFELDPQIELVALERPGADALRVFIDHPDGVDLALCEQASAQLRNLRGDYSLEVSSPGPKFRRPSHVSESKELS